MSTQEIENIPMFFIISRPRTGSTLLRTLFDAHPNVNIPVECQFIIDLYPKYHKQCKWTEKTIHAFIIDLQKEIFFQYWTIDIEKLRNLLTSNKSKLDYALACKAVYQCYESFFKKDKIIAFGDKNPGYSIYTEKLIKLFPGSKFIYLNRDYRDNFVSLKRVDFELPFISMVTYKWKYFYKEFLKQKQKHPSNFYYVRYEDLVNNASKEFAKLCSFLSIPPYDEVFNFHEQKEEVSKLYPIDQLEKYHISLLKPINNKKVGIYSKELSKMQIRIADYVAGPFAEQAGYNRENIQTTLKVKLIAFPGILAGKLLYTLTHIINRFPYRLRELILTRGPFLLGRLFKKTQTKNSKLKTKN